MYRSLTRVRLAQRTHAARLGAAAVLAAMVTTQLALAPQAGAIVGGGPTSTSQHPWMVQIDNGNPIGCGGTLVAPTKVVTAAHCIPADEPSPKLTVIAGEDRYHGKAGTHVPVNRIWVHPHSGDDLPAGTPRVDLAVLTLSRPLAQRTLPLAGPGDSKLYRAGRKGLALGWGADSSTSAPPSTTLRGVTIPVRSLAECLKIYTIDEQRTSLKAGSAFCAGGDGTGAALGDSGGPLVIDGKLAGVVSGGASSEYGRYPARFAKVSTYAAELRRQISAGR
ncbi:S1 family peptidase [Streptomyces sp. 4F14]|uniref:S1 family peptidase n=1 Tax=Streptomyces sp. 4F14 TaxID=3394380 RepID=UPI003A85A575